MMGTIPPPDVDCSVQILLEGKKGIGRINRWQADNRADETTVSQ
jgi:hypothetical protein